MNNKKTFRFGLPHLFYATAVVAAAIALLGTWGIAWASLVIVFWVFAARDFEREFETKRIEKENKSKPQGTSGFTATELLVVVIILAILVFLLVPTVSRNSSIRVASNRMRNINNVRQLVLAFHNYESAYGHFPPAYLADENGKPMHSWRVLILPFIEQNDVYELYDFGEPWDGPNNSKLVDQLSDWSPFRGFSASDEDGQSVTPFKLVTGPGTAFDADRTVSFGDITAGSSNTIAIVQDSASPVCWMSPDDLTVDQTVEIFDATKNPASMAHVTETKFSKTTHYYACLGVLDGSTETAGKLEDPNAIRRFFDIEDREARDLNDLDYHPMRNYEVKAEGYILVGINLLLAILPGFWMRFKRRS